MEYFINISYIVASALFIFGIKMLGSADTARRGNLTSSAGMLIAVIVTLLNRDVNDGNSLSFGLIAVGLLIGAGIGMFAAKKVQMTGMPELVALFNGFGGLASLLVGWAEFAKEGNFNNSEYPIFTAAAVVFAILAPVPR